MLLLCMFYCPLTKDEIKELLLLLTLKIEDLATTLPCLGLEPRPTTYRAI